MTAAIRVFSSARGQFIFKNPCSTLAIIKLWLCFNVTPKTLKLAEVSLLKAHGEGLVQMEAEPTAKNFGFKTRRYDCLDMIMPLDASNNFFQIIRVPFK